MNDEGKNYQGVACVEENVEAGKDMADVCREGKHPGDDEVETENKGRDNNDLRNDTDTNNGGGVVEDRLLKDGISGNAREEEQRNNDISNAIYNTVDDCRNEAAPETKNGNEDHIADVHIQPALRSPKEDTTSCNELDEGELVLTDEELNEQRLLARKTFFILFAINVVAFLASFFFWIQNGVFPYLTRNLGVNPEIFGYIESSFAFYQLIGSPIFGRCGDVFGTRIVMIVSEIASTVSYGTLALASNIGMLFLSRVPALAMHNLQGSYMIISDITLPEDRANMLGKLGVSHGLGMVAGSFVGGVITHVFSERAATVVSACGNITCVVIIYIFIPTNTKTIRYQLEEQQNRRNKNFVNQPVLSFSSFSMKQIFSILKMKVIQYLLFLKIMSAFPFSLIYSMFSIAIMDYFGLGASYNGLILAYVGGLGIFVQGVLIGLLTKTFNDPELTKYAMFLITGSFLFLIVADNIYFFCFLLFPLSVGAITSHIVLLAAITKVVPITDTGSALGLTLALHAVVRSIAPSLGGLLFTNIGWPIFGVVGYAMHLFLSGYILTKGRTDY